MSMQSLMDQYHEQLKEVKGKIKQLEKNHAIQDNPSQYRGLKSMKRDLQFSISQMKKYK